jgi:hypothetical protein
MPTDRPFALYHGFQVLFDETGVEFDADKID